MLRGHVEGEVQSQSGSKIEGGRSNLSFLAGLLFSLFDIAERAEMVADMVEVFGLRLFSMPSTEAVPKGLESYVRRSEAMETWTITASCGDWLQNGCRWDIAGYNARSWIRLVSINASTGHTAYRSARDCQVVADRSICYKANI